jgi:ketosteroid isomerase-like protein
MMKVKNVQNIICLVIIFLFANQAWAADWIYYYTSDFGDSYYDKSSIKKVNESIISVWTKNILSDDAKTKYFSILKRIHKAPQNPSMLCYYTKLTEIDCVNKRIKDISAIFYNEKSEVVYTSPKSESGEWNAILPNTVAEKLNNIISWETVTPNEAVVTPKVEEPVTPKEAVVAATSVTDNLAQVKSNQKEKKAIPKEAIRDLLTKWLTSWKSGDMKTYRSCYASDFQSKGMNLDAWVSHTTNVYQKSKNINVSIDNLQISADENFAAIIFTQHYSSSILKDSGKKTLELRKINDEWKIYREIM